MIKINWKLLTKPHVVFRFYRIKFKGVKYE